LEKISLTFLQIILKSFNLRKNPRKIPLPIAEPIPKLPRLSTEIFKDFFLPTVGSYVRLLGFLPAFGVHSVPKFSNAYHLKGQEIYIITAWRRDCFKGLGYDKVPQLFIFSTLPLLLY
jgi:hypothetical protein